MAQAACRLTTFGSLVLTVNGTRVPEPATQKARAILVYCVLHRRAGVARERLLELFWPEVDPERSRASLSTALHSIRRGFRSLSLDSDDFLVANKSVVRWAAEITVDIEEFRALAGGDSPQAWEEALRLCQGEFLDGDYDEWVVAERERLAEEVERVLSRAVATSADSNLARELIARNPYSEEAYAALIASSLAAGRTQVAMEIAGRYLDALREIDATPSDAFLAQYGSLLRAQSALPLASAFALPFVGREAELQALSARIDALASGAGSVVVLVGDAGIGKSAVIAQMLRAAAVESWHIRCAEDDPRVYGPWEAVFADFVGEPIERALAGADNAPAIALAARIDGALGAQPHVIVVDDVQYLRGEALEVLLDLARLARRRHAFVLAMRPEGEGLLAPLFAGGGVHEVRLAPLSREAFDLALLQGAGIRDDAFASAVFERTRGHPLFFNELIAMLVRDGALERQGRRWRLTKAVAGPLPLPASVLRTIEGRLRSRGHDTALVATVLALDSEVEVADIAAICGFSDERALDAIDDLLALGVVGESASSAQFAFSHDLVREVAASLPSKVRRRALHAALAQRLETVTLRNVSMRRARHLAAAGNAEAAARGYLDAAMDAYEWDALRDVVARCDLALEQTGYMRPGSARDVLSAQGKALKGGTLANLARLTEGYELTTQAVREARATGDTKILARTLLARGHVASSADDGAAQLADADEVVALACAAGNPVQLGQGLYQRANALANLYRIDDAGAAAEDVVTHVTPTEQWILAAATMNSIVPMYAAHWRFADAERAAQRGLSFARRTGLNMEASTLSVCAAFSYLRGDFAQTTTELDRIAFLLEEAQRYPEPGVQQGFVPAELTFTLHYMRGIIARASGRLDEAWSCVQQLELYRDFLAEPVRANALHFLAIDVLCDRAGPELATQAPPHLSALRVTRRQTKFGFSGCAALSSARVAVVLRQGDVAALVRAALVEVERNAERAPLDCLRAFRELQHSAETAGVADIAGRLAELVAAYERRHAEAQAERAALRLEPVPAAG